MENRVAGVMDQHPAYVSLILAMKHFASLAVIFDKVPAKEISLKKLDERVRDGCNLIKIAGAFIHAEHNDFEVKV